MTPHPAIWEATLASLHISLVTALLSGVLGAFFAWLMSRTDVPGRQTLAGLLSISYALPPYLLGMAWVVLGNPTVGILKDVLPASGVYGTWGIILVLTSVTFVYPYLELRAGFARLDPVLEEAARMSGATPARVFRDVSIPLLWPAAVNGMCLAFLHTLAAFGVPALLGLPVRKFVLTTLIYSQLKVGGLTGLKTGLWLSLSLLTIAATALLFSKFLNHRQRQRSGSISGGKSSRPSLVKLGIWSPVLSAVCWATLVVIVVLPWIALSLSALAPVAGHYDPSLWTLSHIREVLSLPDFKNALVNSAILTLICASLVVAASFLLAFRAVRKKSHLASWIIEAFGIPFATPGTVLAMALIFAFGLLSRFGFYTDFPLLIIGVAYVMKYAAVGARSMVVAFSQIDPTLEEAARISGARTGTLLWTIWFPLLKKTFISAWILAALPMLTELTMSVLLTGPGAETLGTVLFELQEYRDQPSAAALAWLLLTVALISGFVTRLATAPRENL